MLPCDMNHVTTNGWCQNAHSGGGGGGGGGEMATFLSEKAKYSFIRSFIHSEDVLTSDVYYYPLVYSK